MLFWSIAIGITVIVCAALYYAPARRGVNSPAVETDATETHFRQLLSGIAEDERVGRIARGEAEAAKAELAREVVRHRAEADSRRDDARSGRWAVLSGSVAVAVLAFGLYAVLGSSGAPDEPLAERADLAALDIDLDVAIEQVEARLAEAPDDLQGWQVIAPVYLRQGRFEDAVDAYRRIRDLAGASSVTDTDLAEALILSRNGDASGEPMELLTGAVDAQPANIRAQYYIANELMRTGQFEDAQAVWREVIELSVGNEPWLAVAREGLAVAENNMEASVEGGEIDASESVDMDAQIAGMVSGLATRLEAEGGTIEEWTQLVRSYIVLDEIEAAREAYDAAIAAYPDAAERRELDDLAREQEFAADGDDQ